MNRTKTTNYFRRLGWMLTVASIVFGVLVITGFGNRDACLDEGGRWVSDICDGVNTFVPLAARPKVWGSIAPTAVLGVALIFVARKRSSVRRPSS